MSSKGLGIRPLVECLVGSLRDVFEQLSDPRQGKNKQYRFSDIVMSAFSMFFIQSPSFLEHQRVFHKRFGKNARH